MGLGFPKLDGTNYRIWTMRMTDLLQREGLWQLITGDEVIVEKPESLSVVYEKNLDRYQAQQRRLLKAMGTLRMGMTDAIAVGYYGPAWKTPRLIWEHVSNQYETAINYDANYLQKELYECTLEDAGTVLEYLNWIRELRDKLTISGQPPTHTQLIFHIFEGLPKTPEWKTWVMITKAALPSLSTTTAYSQLQGMLKAFEVELRRERAVEPGQALFSKSGRKGGRSAKAYDKNKGGSTGISQDKASKPKFTGSCHYCGKQGHKARECRSKHRDEGYTRSAARSNTSQPGRVGVMEEEMWLATKAVSKDKSEVEAIESAMLGKQVVQEIDWVIDSGCTNHMTRHEEAFIPGSYHRLTKDERQMRTATGEVVSATGIGTVRIKIWSPDRGERTILLTDVLHIPEAGATSLISVDQLSLKGIDVWLKRESAEVYKDGILVAIAKKVDRLYLLRSLSLWLILAAGNRILLLSRFETNYFHYRLVVNL